MEEHSNSNALGSMMGYLPTSAFHLFGTHFLCNLNVWDVFPLSTHAWHFLGFVKCPRNPLIHGVGFAEFLSFKSLKFIYLFTPPGRATTIFYAPRVIQR
jgi:hypothetical protein